MAIQNIACEPLGRFGRAGDARFIYIRPYEGEAIPSSLEGWDGVIILGGPMAVYEPDDLPYLKDLLSLIRQAIDADFPLLGVCLGSQLIARAAGADVFAGPLRELGFSTVGLTADAASDPLFSGLPSPLPVFQLHGDTFDLPSGATLLATGEAYQNQAFRLGGNVYGLQFHIEVNEPIVRDWAVIYRDYISEGGANVADILRGPQAGYATFEGNAGLLIDRFLRLCGGNQ